MSFLQRLRMNNVFGGDMFTPLHGVNIDPYQEIINDFQRYQSPDTIRPIMQRPMVNQPLARPSSLVDRPTSNQELRFGGVFDSGNNPGADILARSAKDANDIYESYKKPALQAGNVLAAAGIKPNEQFPKIDLDAELKRELTKSQIKENEAKTAKDLKENATDLKQIVITDPNDSTKQITVNYNKNTGEVTPITLPSGKNAQPGTQAKTNLVEQEKQKKQDQAEEAIKQHAQDALNVLNEISDEQIDPKGNYNGEKLKPNTQNVTGFSGNVPNILSELIPGNASALASIKRLQDMLTLNRMQQLRGESKTGSTGFGSNMNQKEFSTLVSAASKLNTRNMSESDYAQELGRIRTLLKKVISGSNTIRREIPNSGGRMAISTDNGKTWKAE